MARGTLRETNIAHIAPEKWQLDDYFPFGFGPIFRGYVSSREGRSNCPLLISPCSCCIFNVKTCSRNAEPMPSAGTCGASNHIRGCWISSNGFRVRILVLDITWRNLEDFWISRVCYCGSSHIFSGATVYFWMFTDVYRCLLGMVWLFLK